MKKLMKYLILTDIMPKQEDVDAPHMKLILSKSDYQESTVFHGVPYLRLWVYTEILSGEK